MSQSKCGKNEFSAMFWNVENLGKGLPAVDSDMSAKAKETRKRKHHKRVKKVADHIKALDPDLFCLCEIWDKAVLRRLLMHELTDYDFAVTDGGGDIELVTAWKRGTFKQVIFVQRVKFQAGNEDLRPGALASVMFGGEWFNFLFLHLKSGTLCSAYKLRKDMFEKIWALKGRLDGIHTDELRDGASDNGASDNGASSNGASDNGASSNGASDNGASSNGASDNGASSNGASDNGASSNGAKFVVMGDLNTMGRSDCARSDDISADEELQQLEKAAESKGMRLLPKTSDKTWSNDTSSKTSDLDHVLATKDNVRFNKPQADVEVRVSGWNDEPKGKKRKAFIKNISDHSSLFCEIVVDERASESASTAEGSS